MDLRILEDLYNNFNNRFKQLDSQKEQVAVNIRNKREAVKAENAKIVAQLQQKVKQYIDMEVTEVKSKINKVAARLSNIPAALKSTSLNINYATTYEESIADCTIAVSNINAILAELNAFDFNVEAPPLDYIAKGEEAFLITDAKGLKIEVNYDNADSSKPTIEPEPAQGIKSRLYSAIMTANKQLDNLAVNINNKYSLTEFTGYLDNRAKLWMSDQIDQYNTVISEAMHNKLAVEDELLNEELFDKIVNGGRNAAVDPETGVSDFSEKVKLFDVVATMVDDEEHIEYISQSPIMQQNFSDGEFKFPYVIDLKECGNIYLRVDSEKAYHNNTVAKFVHNTILHFLMSQPAGRLNLCLINPENKLDFSRYTRMQSFNANAIGTGIVRDQENVEPAIKNVERSMHDIYDNKIARSDLSNVFEYNQMSDSNPQSLTLVVVVNYPEGVTQAANQRLLNLVCQGNRSGIFTLIVGDRSAMASNSITSTDGRKTTLGSHMHVFATDGDGVSIDKSYKNDVSMDDRFNIENCTSLFSVMQNRAKNDHSRSVIKLEKLFKITDEARAKGTIEPSSEVIDIPLGMRGGEIQSVKLSTNGSGSAHMVVIGGTGSGKSNLLHTIIMSSAYKYSPKEYVIYLVDFKGGVEFKYYQASNNVAAQLPHIKLTGLTSDPEDGVAILANVQKELRAREDLFRNNNVEDIVKFNENVNKGIIKLDILPRMLLIIDEVQELFERNESLGHTAINIMSELFKKGRAFGISILWASQNVPKVAGLRDKVISQIGNRISLKLHNPDDAQDIGISPLKVRELNRPEKGLAIIKESDQGENQIEFRVAYAEDSDRRRNYDKTILSKWAVKDKLPLFVVGSSERPHPIKGITKYNQPTFAKQSYTNYDISLGQNYITGKDYMLNIDLRGSKSNLWIAGANVSEIRDLMGYALLSVCMNNIVNNELSDNGEIHYINGELIDQNDPDDLFYILPDMFKEQINNIRGQRDVVDTFIKLYKTRKERSEYAQTKYPPIFVFINKIQAYADLFKDHSRLYDVSGNEAQEPVPVASSSGSFSFQGFSSGISSIGSSSGASGTKLNFAAIFNEVLGRGSDVNIHFVFSIDTPSSIGEITSEMKAQVNKIILKGVRSDDLLSVLPSSRMTNVIANEGLCYCYHNDEMSKFKPYRYNSEVDHDWMLACVDKCKAAK